MDDTILRVDDIQKFYGNKGNLTKAVDHISFSVRKGEFLGIMGSSGSGKTTLLNCISTIDTVTSGHIYVEGKDINVLLVQYKPGVDSNEVLQKMVPIGLDEAHGYRYAEKNMMYEMFYGLNALVSFLCCYIGLIFLLICAALLALKQLTETTDNIYRYGLLQKLGAKRKQINRTLFTQTAVFFAIPLTVAGIYSAFLIGKAMTIVEEFMNIHISTNVGLTVILFLIIYGSYFLATYLSCKRIVTEQKNRRYKSCFLKM